MDNDITIFPKFELISKYVGRNELLPKRATAGSAGYDFYVAEPTVVPALSKIMPKLEKAIFDGFQSEKIGMEYLNELPLDILSKYTKMTGVKPTLVPTGIKARMPSNMYLQLSVRSSCPLKTWLILANGVGIIDSDYYNNPDNEGHIFFQMINLSSTNIQLYPGDKIGQGIFIPYFTTENDFTEEKRTGGFGSTQ